MTQNIVVPNKQFVFKQPATGVPKPGVDLATETSEIDLSAPPPEGSVLVKVLFFSLDPYLRGKMRPANVPSYSAAWAPGTVMPNQGVAQVLVSSHPKFKRGDVITATVRAEEYSIVGREELEKYDTIVVPRDSTLPLSNWCGVLGMPGLTAYSSLYNIVKPVKGETIWVSAAAGPVGQIVGQLAKREGLRVIGSVGGDKKVDFVTKELGFDAAFNYKKESPLKAIKRLAPDGLDIFYDNVGGEQLDVALGAMKNRGRIGEWSTSFFP